MIILTAAVLAAAQPAPAPAAPAGTPATHRDHAAHGQMRHGENCPCCDHNGSNQGDDCCAEMRQQHRGHDEHRQ